MFLFCLLLSIKSFCHGTSILLISKGESCALSAIAFDMEHILHIFGGGCGEHMIWPLILSFLTGGAVYFGGGK